MRPECLPLNENVSKSMRGNKRKDTKPELKLRRALRDAGMPGYRLQWRVPGRPDICYPGKKIAIFVNGCFWHHCPICNLPAPRNNSDYWFAKLQRNVQRDEEKNRELLDLGWNVIVVWECEIEGEIESVVSRIEVMYRSMIDANKK